MKLLTSLALLCVVIWAETAVAQVASPTLDLRGSLDSRGLIGHVDSWLDTSNSYTIDSRDDMPFRPVTSRSVDYGYVKGTVWLRISVRNLTEASTQWRAHLRENFFPFVRAYAQQGSQAPVIVEKQDLTTRFQDRALTYPNIVIPLTLPVGEVTTIYISYRSGGSSQTSFSLKTAEDFAVHATIRVAKNFAYYGMMMFLTIAATIAFLATRQIVILAYGAYAFAALMFMMHADGNAFRYLWPGAPVFNSYASLFTGMGVIVCGANFARHFLQTRVYHPIFDALLLGVMGVTTLLVASALFVDAQLIKKGLVLMAFSSILLFTLAGLNAARTRFREVRFYVLAFCGAVISSAIMTARHWLGIDISEEFQFDSMRIVTTLDAAFMGLAILDRFNQMKRARQRALESSLSAAQQSLELSRRLQELEEDYVAAQELAETRGRRISDTAHDLRQPLHALRLNVQALVNTPSSSGLNASDVEETFAYLETLVANELSAQSESVGTTAPEREQSEIANLFKRLEDMLGPDAREKGLDLRIVPSSRTVAMPALDLMRIASNLVSNAIKYTEAGKVVVGIRQRGGTLRLEVHDTGAGLTGQTFAQARMRGQRLENGDGSAGGHGLGLSIVCRLLAERGLAIGLLPRRTGGTSVFVELPMD